MDAQKKKKKMIRKIIYYALLGIFAAVFIGSAVYLISYFSNSHKTTDLYSGLADIKSAALNSENTSNSQDPTDSGGSQQGDASPGSGILPEYQALYEMNSDIVGWITIPGTDIDYPVMQTPDNTDYYLYRDFNKEYNRWGCIYVRESCDVFTPSDNITIYGHHMKDGSMFADLDFFKEKSFWENHRTFTFDTIYEHHTYEIVAVFKTSANLGKGFSYHTFETASSEEEFNEFISTVKSLQFYETGVTAQYGDMLLCLSTCEYTLDNGRFVVVAKRIS